MSLKVGANIPSITAQRHLGKSTKNVADNMRSLATGSRFDGSAPDPAGFAISEHLRGQARGLKTSRLNTENAMSFIQVAEGGLNEQHNILIRLRELAVQAASDTFSDEERGFLNVEYQKLVEEFDRIAKTTQFGSTKLLQGGGRNYEFQVGPYADKTNTIGFSLSVDTTSRNMGIESTEVASTSRARRALGDIDKAIQDMSEARAHFGATHSQLSSALGNLEVQYENIVEARSRIADTDFAEATSELAKNQILQNVQLAVLGQARLAPDAALRLLV